ncbi:MAG: hypothetical protein R3A46_03875 [Thermomicrobiales bacterium]
MSRPIFLVSNERSAAGEVGQACRARGLDVPAWCVVRQGSASQLASETGGYVIIGSSGAYPGWELARLLDEAARKPSVVFVGEPDQASHGTVRVIDRSSGWPDRVAEQLIDLLGLTPVILPNYENRLRVLGRELDRRGYLSVSIVEDGDRLRIRPEPGDEGNLPPFDFSTRDFGRLVRESLTARGEADWERPRGRLASSGHERLLRYLGQGLDRRGAERVQIVSLARSLVVSGYQSESPYEEPEPFNEMYRETQLEALQQGADLNRRGPDRWFGRLSRRLGIG